MTTITLAQIASNQHPEALPDLPSLSRPAAENFTFDDLRLGDRASLTHTLSADDVRAFAALTGDHHPVHPVHLDAACARHTAFHTVIAHGMWGASLISTLIGTRLPGPGTICMNQRWQFVRPVHVGDTLTARVSVAIKDAHSHHITLACRCTNQHGDDVITGSAQVLAPADKLRRAQPAQGLPAAWVAPSDRFAGLWPRVAGLPAIKVAVVWPCSEVALQGALQAAHLGLIVPVFIGPQARLQALAAQCHLDLSPYRVVDAPGPRESARLAVSMARQHEVQALMKGGLHTDELLDEVLNHTHGLCTARHVSQVFVLDMPGVARPVLITDDTLDAQPGLGVRSHTVQNAIDLAHMLGVARPKVAILAGAESLDVGSHSAVDTASLCAMARKGQITGAVLDGPLSLDNALSLQAALDHGVVSPVAGQADVLVAPALHAGRTITRHLQYLADAQVAGVLMGTRVPVILSSPADGLLAAPAACALALLMGPVPHLMSVLPDCAMPPHPAR